MVMFIEMVIGRRAGEGITGMHQVAGNNEEKDGFGYKDTGNILPKYLIFNPAFIKYVLA